MGFLAIEAAAIAVQCATGCDCGSRLFFQQFLSEFPASFLSISVKSAANYVFINGDFPELEYPDPSLLKQKLTAVPPFNSSRKILDNCLINCAFDNSV